MALRVGSVTPRFVAEIGISPSAVGPQKMSLETYTVNGLAADMVTVVTQPVLDQNYFRVLDSRVTSANTLEICWVNFGNGNNTVTPGTTQSCRVIAF